MQKVSNENKGKILNYKYQINNATENDLKFIQWMFDEAIAYQKRNNYPEYTTYHKEILLNDITEKHGFKIVLENKIVLAFSITYTDKVFWREREKSDAIYLHRIVVNPDFKGQKLFGELLSWAIHYAQENELRFLRMDTWRDNSKLVSYYQSFGFRFIEDYKTPDILEINNAYRNKYLTLLELDITKCNKI